MFYLSSFKVWAKLSPSSNISTPCQSLLKCALLPELCHYAMVSTYHCLYNPWDEISVKIFKICLLVLLDLVLNFTKELYCKSACLTKVSDHTQYYIDEGKPKQL